MSPGIGAFLDPAFWRAPRRAAQRSTDGPGCATRVMYCTRSRRSTGTKTKSLRRPSSADQRIPARRRRANLLKAHEAAAIPWSTWTRDSRN